MRVGVFLVSACYPEQTHAEVLETTVAAAQEAESAGFDSVWLAEHHFMSYGVCPSAVTLAGHLLGGTERITVGTAVSVLSTWHPVALAEQTNLLDQVSGSRFRLGVGRGGPWRDLEVFGTGLARFEDGFEESLQLLLHALAGGQIRAEGPQFRFRSVPMVPDPRSRPRPPVTVAATSESTLALAARNDLPLLLGMHQTPEQQAKLVVNYRRLGGADGASTARRQGIEPGHVVTALAHVADTTEQARAEVQARLPEWLGPGLAGYVPVDGRPRPQRDVHAYTRFLVDTHAVGDPEHCAHQLRHQLGVTGASEVILLVETSGQRRATLANIARLGTDVLPRLRASSPRAPGTDSTAEP
ncbi:LLM class flavin-dependent oxidoreductase [Lipingzhangella sp. LS1_29]|uniref:LLM class flavin-dependent oxidoreductase n=1 Tax=Lipingzhangella rawalii TaxID=2055835 RepID=A0ABU2H792_9ACTN|nr:LLM class flavin-dependent oxidoreductase [Lipingzhangella rawalii]MDS1270484.1 LLM class flavin-dependent oxidoreductase [Lipingzhangella rawalii]